MTQGQDSSLFLTCTGLPPATRCQLTGALAHRLASPLGQIRPGVAPGRQDVYTEAFTQFVTSLSVRHDYSVALGNNAGGICTRWTSGFLGRTLFCNAHHPDHDSRRSLQWFVKHVVRVVGSPDGDTLIANECRAGGT